MNNRTALLVQSMIFVGRKEFKLALSSISSSEVCLLAFYLSPSGEGMCQYVKVS